MDTPKLLVTKGSFDSSHSSDSDEDDAALFQKYSTTPPTRQFVKMRRHGKEARSVAASSKSKAASASSYSLDLTDATGKAPRLGQQAQKYRQKENSVQRSSDRRIKWRSADAANSQAGALSSDATTSDDDSLNDKSPNQRIKVESRNRFMSLCSRLIKLPRKLRSRNIDALQNPTIVACQTRAEFHTFFADLMKRGNFDSGREQQHQQQQQQQQQQQHEKREEELIWQSELKDLLWLELQAWLSDRTPQEQDSYLYIQRQRIPDVLNRIMDYHFEPVATIRRSTETNLSDAISLESVSCLGCLDAFCEVCALNLSKALYEVSDLLKELDSVEELYPSGRSLGHDYPLYADPAFTDRIKTLCLWYNVTYLLQLKIDIIGHMLVSLGSKGLPWPAWPAWPPASPDHDRLAGDYCDSESADDQASVFYASPAAGADAFQRKMKPMKREKSRVQFFVDGDSTSVNRAQDSPADSVKSEYSGADLPEADSELKSNNFTPESPSEARDRPRYAARPAMHLRCDSYGASSETDSDFSKLSSGFETPDGRLLYRSYIERALKSRGLRKMLRWMFFIHRVNMVRAKAALQKTDASMKNVSGTWASSSSSSPFLYDEYESLGTRRADDEMELLDLRRYGAWSPEFQLLNLPAYRTLYLFLCRMPMDVIRESLCIRLEQKPAEPSALSIRQLMQEFKEGLKVGVICKQKYLRDMRAVQANDGEDFPHLLLEKEFNEILKQTLNAYLDYLQRWVGMGSLTNHFQKNALELEWNFTRSVCSAIPGGEMLAGNAFCTIACSMLNATGAYLRNGIRRQRIDCQCDFDTSGSETEERLEKDTALCVLRRIQRVLSEAREQCLRAVCVAKMIRRDLEVAAEFDIRMPLQTLLHRLAETDHVQVVFPHSDNYVVFVPDFLRDQKEYLHCLLDLSSRSECQQQSTECTDSGIHCPSTNENNPENEGYMILMQAPANRESMSELWEGETVKISDLRDDAILRSHVQREVLLLVVFNAIHLSKRRRELQDVLGPGLELRYENRPSNYVVAESLLQLKNELINLSETIIAAIQEIVNRMNVNNYSAIITDPCEQAPLVSRWREVVRHAFKLGFEFNRDVLRLVSGKPSVELALKVVKLAKLWMHFTVTYCERGRGLRPKWAAQGLDFLGIACEAEITCHLSDDEFANLKESIGQCVCHIVGSLDQKSLKAPSSAPISRRRSRLSASALSPMSNPDITPFASPRPSRRPSVHTMTREDSSRSSLSKRESNGYLLDLNGASTSSWRERVKRSAELMDAARDSIMEEANLIGHVSRVTREAKWQMRLKSVQFSWQRGVKIGQGRFGKVYVAVNNQTGELMAMKEIPLQSNDHRTIRSVADELRIFEGINHPHLVRYYGVEIHREEMYIFMEFCPEGTLEQLVSSTEAGLPEELIRRYTRQLLEAVAVLHQNGIVHRDIKGANIFLYESGNCLKLGDFGCAAKIKSHTTMIGELQGFVGTQAFMAPEVFMHSLAEGHGRAADIWSVGCVVIEMATGKRPWHELESNYAIMFKVGMGEVPPTPATLSEEGKAFLSLMLQHDPKLRETAANLLEHNFLKVYQEE